jgi:hypothetical protein
MFPPLVFKEVKTLYVLKVNGPGHCPEKVAGSKLITVSQPDGLLILIVRSGGALTDIAKLELLA